MGSDNLFGHNKIGIRCFKIKTVVKDKVEDHSRNIMMFELEETERQNMDFKVRDIMKN